MGAVSNEHSASGVCFEEISENLRWIVEREIVPSVNVSVLLRRKLSMLVQAEAERDATKCIVVED